MDQLRNMIHTVITEIPALNLRTDAHGSVAHGTRKSLVAGMDR